MAVDFAQHEGFSQTVLKLDLGAAPDLPFSFACFFKPAQTWVAADRCLMCFAIPGGNGDSFRLMLGEVDDQPGTDSDTGTVRAVVNDFIFVEGTPTTASFQFYEWNHAAAVYAGSGAPGSNPPTSITSYVNGAGTTLVGPTLSPDNTRWIFIGGRGPGITGTSSFIGCMAHAAIWRIALSAEQVALLAAGTLPDDHVALGTDSGDLIGYWALADAATATVATAGSDLTLDDDPPVGVIATCIDSPEIPEPEPEPATGCDTEDEADEQAAADVTWPECVLVPSTIDPQVVSPTTSPGRSLSGREQVVQADAGHIRIELIGIKVWTNTEILRWREIESTLNGRNGTVLVPIYEAVLSDTPIAATSAADADIGSVRLKINQTAGFDIRKGMWFSCGERGYLLKRVIGEDDDGFIDVMVSPPLRDFIAQNDALEFNTPRVRCRLEQDNGMALDQELLQFGKPSVAFVEDV